MYSNMQLHQQSIALGSSRNFSLDLAGKVVFCASEAIDTMLAFGVQSYLEFKLFQGSYLYTGGKLTSVPASRAAVFRDRSLSPLDKRLLTRFLMQLGNSIHGNTFPQADQSSPLVALLKAQGLSPLMRQYIMYAVAMADSDQESPLAQQTSTTAPERHPTATQAVPQPGNNATPTITEPSSATPEDVSSEATPTPTAPDCSDAQAHRPAPVQSASSPHYVADTFTSQPTSEASTSDAAPTAAPHSAPQSAPQPVAARGLCDGLMSVQEGVKALRQYMSSVGRYGPNSGAILTPMYGCAELPQAFCRVAAVNGAVYVLRQPIHSLLLDPETRQCRGIQTDTGQVVMCSALAASASILQPLLHAPQSPAGRQQPGHDDRGDTPPTLSLSRAVCILDGPIQEGEPQLLITIPPNTAPLQNTHAIRLIQVGSPAAVCPANRHLLYMSTPSTATASEDLSQALSALVDTSKVFASVSASATPASAPGTSAAAASDHGTDRQPEALLVAFYNQQCQQQCDSCGRLPSNVACCLPPDGCLDVDSAFRHAKKAFKRLYPDEAGAFEPAVVSCDDAESDDEALDALGDVLQNLGAA
ncbi:hypothetical protein ABBQ38_001051 [Trebouxia sp. C0009 RCD-2024]